MDWSYVLGLLHNGDLWRATLLVAELSSLAWVISTVLAMFLALAKQSPRVWLRWPATCYVWLFRSLPLLVLLIFVYNSPQAFPDRDVVGSAFRAGLVALVLSETAYISEIHRGGLLAVAHGQGEAARALGLRWATYQLLIVIPQAFRVSLPTLGNELVTIVKLTSLVSAISLSEILFVGQQLYTENFKVLDTLLGVAIYYVFIVTVFDQGRAALERRLDVSRRHTRLEVDPLAEDAGELPAVAARPRVPHNGEVVLEATGVTKRFGDATVLRGVDLQVHRGRSL